MNVSAIVRSRARIPVSIRVMSMFWIGVSVFIRAGLWLGLG